VCFVPSEGFPLEDSFGRKGDRDISTVEDFSMRKTSEAKTIFGIIGIHIIYIYIYGPNKMKTQQTRLET